MSGTLPFTLDNLAAGAVRVILAPITVTAFTTPKSAFDQEAPYLPKTDFIDLGATSGPFTYDRNLTVDEYKIEQQTSAVLQTPNEIVRQIKIPLAEVSPVNMQLFEFADEIEEVAASAHASAFQMVRGGSITDLPAYRILFVGQRSKQQGIVIESGTALNRGRFYGAICHRATITADSSTVSYGKGNLVTLNITLKLFPEPGQPQGKEYIAHFDETAGTILAS